MYHRVLQFRAAAPLALAAALWGGNTASGATFTLYAPAAGDATYAWNSKYGPYGYGTGTESLGVGLSMGGTYGNDRTVSIFEIPIGSLAGKTVSNATLQLDSLGFSTGYYYGSIAIGWLNVGTTVVTGDVVADNLGPAATGIPTNWSFDVPVASGLLTFDATSVVQSDLDAGRGYSTFVLSGSRDTYGGIRSAESGSTGPQIIASVPEPGSLALCLGALALGLRRRRQA